MCFTLGEFFHPPSHRYLDAAIKGASIAEIVSAFPAAGGLCVFGELCLIPPTHMVT